MKKFAHIILFLLAALILGAVILMTFARQVGLPAARLPARQGQAGETQTLPVLGPQEREYFSSLYRGTWNYLADSADPGTGIPYDSSARQPVTSLSNVGLYLAAVSMAYRTRLIPEKEGMERIEKCLTSLEKVETWRGIPRPWFLVRKLQPSFGDEFSYGPHLANLLGGLIVSKTVFPGLQQRTDHLLLKMELKPLYDRPTGWLKGGYNVKTQNFAIFQAWGHWYYKYFASETRLLSFYLIARKLVPADHWKALIRPVRKSEGEKFFLTGPEDGGMYASYLTGLFLDERKTEMGASQRHYALSQMKHAKKIGAPVWGWSSAENPRGRYQAYGELQDEIAAPYASVLAAIYFPKQAWSNLKKLEDWGGRPHFEGKDFGFLDSVNWKTGETAKNHLTVHQAMAFLALANLLYDGIVWKTFAEDPVVARGIRSVGSLSGGSDEE